MFGTVRTAPFLSTSQIRLSGNRPNKLQRSIFRHHLHLAEFTLAYIVISQMFFWNARSIRNKVSDFRALLLTDPFLDIVSIAETWLDQNYLDCELQLEGNNLYRRIEATGETVEFS